MRERPKLDLTTLKARCPVVIHRPLATWLHYALVITAAITWPVAVVLLARGWSLPAQIGAAIGLLAGFVPLVALARHVRLTGAFRLAADERHLYFRETQGGAVRAMDWQQCTQLGTIRSLGERAIRLEFERYDGEPAWTSLRHARVFVRDTSVEIIAMNLSNASLLVNQLNELRQRKGSRSPAGAKRASNRAAA